MFVHRARCDASAAQVDRDSPHASASAANYQALGTLRELALRALLELAPVAVERCDGRELLNRGQVVDRALAPAETQLALGGVVIEIAWPEHELAVFWLGNAQRYLVLEAEDLAAQRVVPGAAVQWQDLCKFGRRFRRQ